MTSTCLHVRGRGDVVLAARRRERYLSTEHGIIPSAALIPPLVLIEIIRPRATESASLSNPRGMFKLRAIMMAVAMP